MRALWAWWAVAFGAGCSGAPFTTLDAGASGSSSSSGSTGSSSGSPFVTPEAGASGAASSGSAPGSGSSGSAGSASGGSSGATGSSSGAPVQTCPTGYALCSGAQCCLPNEQCIENAEGNICSKICTASTQCGSGACAPLVDSSGNPTGPYVCKPNDGHAYDGCGPAVCNACATTGFSCEKAGENSFYYCGKGCKVPADCPGACCLTMAACGFCPLVGTCSAGVCGPCGP